MDEAATAFRCHYDDVFRFVRRHVSSDTEAEDVTQSVFVQAAARLERPRSEASPVLAWLYTVAQHRLIDEARKRSRQGTSAPLEPTALDGGEPLYGSEVASTLRGALADLPQSNRAVVVMRLIQGRSFAEIADQVGASEAACKMRFLRGLATVREAFQKEGLEP